VRIRTSQNAAQRIAPAEQDASTKAVCGRRARPWAWCLAAWLALAGGALLPPHPALAQPHTPNRVPLAFDRFYNYDEMVSILRSLAGAYPDLVTVESIGKSTEQRDIWLVTINNRMTGLDGDKPAMYIDANVHGNEVQGTEVCLYTIWHLTKSHGVIDKLTRLVDERAFYIVPCVNPDGRAHWFDEPNTSSSSRSGKMPTDNDFDGLTDEDGDDDLDGDGQITTMWKQDPTGRYRRSNRDPRIFERVADDEIGDFMLIGSEGIDNDADGRLNEDGPGGYDMNRNWPAGWRPVYLQSGAGEYPFSYPETAAIGAFILDHPNIAAVQSYHNAGGMLLRGPGVEEREALYPREDLAVYDQIGRIGERLLPHYRYLVIWKDLYNVSGGFVNWTWEGLGIFSFTNELWTTSQMYYGKEGDWSSDEQRFKFGDLLHFEELFAPYKPYDHPTYGEILIGGWTQYASRVPPTFMLEELCHRNFAFTMYHADQMPRLAFGRDQVRDLGGGAWEVTLELKNQASIPTISTLAADKRLGARDQITLRPLGPGAARVIASGTLDSWYAPTMEITRRDPQRMWVDRGIGRYAQRVFRWIVEGSGRVQVEYRSDKGGTIRQELELQER
jgi:hypothetical protein